MGRNLDVSLQLFRKGTVILIPEVKFKDGVSKPKYAILLEDTDSLYKNGTITACLTTSRKFKTLKSWFVVTSAEIFGKPKEEMTTIDCLNRLALTAKQIEKCRFMSYLPEEIWDEVEEANLFAEFYLSEAKKLVAR